VPLFGVPLLGGTVAQWGPGPLIPLRLRSDVDRDGVQMGQNRRIPGSLVPLLVDRSLWDPPK